MHLSSEDFPTTYREIILRLESIEPFLYGRTRNYLNGNVTRLSPYISRGILSTKQVAEVALRKGYSTTQISKFLQELAWRDYYQQIWMNQPEKIHLDFKHPQTEVKNYKIPKILVEANTQVQAIDSAIRQLYSKGYMHNHFRMYIASIACNIANCHWNLPAKWMYYYLLDADGASNALSWQWVAGTFSSKKYYVNQENINKYSHNTQKGTFLDVPYSALSSRPIPSELLETIDLNLKTQLPSTLPLMIHTHLPIYLYNFYNLDPTWDKNILANRILLLEPSFFKLYPISGNSLDFIISLSKNIQGLQIYVGEFQTLQQNYPQAIFHFKEHPTNRHYQGICHSREWMFEEVAGYFPSFFNFWKKCEKYIEHLKS